MADNDFQIDSEEQRKLIFEKFKVDLEAWRRQLEGEDGGIFASNNRQLMSLDPGENFGKKKLLQRQTRQACPGGVGNFGFNSFNFMTFVLLTLNAVANVNNNINNNNNNNVDINYNTINQDSNNVISNSENMNMVMAMILPVPGKRTLDLFNRTVSHHVNKRCAESGITLTDLVKLEVFDQVRYVAGGNGQKRDEECEGLRVCQAVKRITHLFLRDTINAELLEIGENPFISMTSCPALFPHCVSM